MKRNTKRGSVSLEAALFLPVFVLAVLTIGYFIRIAAVNENITHASLDEANLLAARAYGIKLDPGFPGKLEKRLREENSEAANLKVDRFFYLYMLPEKDGLISFRISGTVDLHMPLEFGKVYDLESRIKCRGFIGKDCSGTAMSFEEMERDGLSDPVWIFPMSGKRYHGKTCTYVQAKPTQMILCKGLQKNYSSCHLCKPESLPVGTFVYCFLRAGEAYHRGDCSTIDKYTVEIEKEDAVRKGYTPCSKCGGGG